MPKNILQDIVPPDKRSIRNIPVPSRDRRKPVLKDVSPAPTPEPAYRPALSDIRPPAPRRIEKESFVSQNGDMEGWDLDSTEHHSPEPRVYGIGSSRSSLLQGRNKRIVIGAGAAALVIAFGALSLFSGAEITLTAKAEEVVVTPETVMTATEEGPLTYNVATLSRQEGKEVQATGQERVERKASGKIVIYNDFGTADQRLIKNTRFETAQGLIYRVNESVVVPGKKGTTPGQVEVEVFADQPGESYNIGKTDFTIPGFKGDPRFEKMYARSVTEMSGGFSGIVRTVSEADRAAARSELQAILTKELESELAAQVPEGFVLLPGAVTYDFRELPQTDGQGNTATVNEEGTATATLLPTSALAKALARELVTVPAELLTIDDVTRLTYVPGRKDDAGNLTFSLDGTASIKAMVDTRAVAVTVAGKKAADGASAIAAFPGVATVEETAIRPFWKRAFPQDPQEITVTVSPVVR